MKKTEQGINCTKAKNRDDRKHQASSTKTAKRRGIQRVVVEMSLSPNESSLPERF
jgi:hypothetical protein